MIKFEILFQASLYDSWPLKTGDVTEFMDEIVYFRNTIDTFCPECEKNSTFKGDGEKSYSDDSLFDKNMYELFITRYVNSIFSIQANCARGGHRLSVTLYIKKKDEYGIYELIKVGQYPSHADTQKPKLKKYNKVLVKENYSDLSNAFICYSHGFNIGAYAYLRRILEWIIEEAHKEAIKTDEWKEEKYKSERATGEKLKMIKSFLPQTELNQNDVYKILSIGVHELTEDKCKSLYLLVESSIEVILDAKLEEIERAKKDTIAKKGLAIFLSKHGKKT